MRGSQWPTSVRLLATGSQPISAGPSGDGMACHPLPGDGGKNRNTSRVFLGWNNNEYTVTISPPD